jgi:hypothetical protein
MAYYRLLHILLPPPSQTEFADLMERYPTESACPFPTPPYSPIITELLDQTAGHLTSIDFVYVFSQSIELVQGALLDQIAREIYNQPAFQQSPLGFTTEATIEELSSKKLVQCLPCLTRWSERVWQAVPDEAIDVSDVKDDSQRHILTVVFHVSDLLALIMSRLSQP